MEPPRQLPEQAAPIFGEGVTLTLARWSALQMAVDNEWGGRSSRQRADELARDIFAWYTQSKEPLYIDDLEDLLYEAMISLNTVAEDGSVEEVAEKLMILHEECLEGNFAAVEKLREASLKRVAPAHVKQVVEGEEEEEEEDSDSEDMAMDDSPNMMVDAPKPQLSPTPVNKAGDEGRPPQDMAMDDSPNMMVDAPKPQSSPTPVDKAGDKGRPPQTADADGWTVVGSKKSRAKK